MKKINLPNNPFKSGVFILMLGFFVNSLAIFTLLTQIMPRSVGAQTASGPVGYKEYWCAGEVYAAVIPEAPLTPYDRKIGIYGTSSRDDLSFIQRFKRDCGWRALYNFSSDYIKSYIKSGDYINNLPLIISTFDEFRTITVQPGDSLYSIVGSASSNNTSDNTINTIKTLLDNLTAPAFAYYYYDPVWSYMINNNTGSRGLDFADQSLSTKSETGFVTVTEWFVYGEIGTKLDNPVSGQQQVNPTKPFGSYIGTYDAMKKAGIPSTQ